MEVFIEFFIVVLNKLWNKQLSYRYLHDQRGCALSVRKYVL